jgi:hypothetical protein
MIAVIRATPAAAATALCVVPGKRLSGCFSRGKRLIKLIFCDRKGTEKLHVSRFTSCFSWEGGIFFCGNGLR